MKLKFKVQPYQTMAVDAVVDCFAGQPFSVGPAYRIDPGKRNQAEAFDDEGFRNPDIALTDAQLLTNINAVQRRQNLPQSPSLTSFVTRDAKGRAVPAPAAYLKNMAAAAPLHLDVEMETGTGKTYCYIKTMFELNRRYGWSKFIIIVPSIAIREGVAKSLSITAEHFTETYGKKARFFIYNSKRLHELESFSSDAGLNVMVMNIQAFNASGKDNRRIYDALDDFQSRKPIDVIAANRPILILDEPQKMEGKATVEALPKFRPLFIMRYSATHRTEHTKIHRLDALDAYNQKLVKKIQVRGIALKGLTGTTAYLYLEGIETVGRGKGGPFARLEMEIKDTTGTIKRRLKRLKFRDDLYDLSGGLDQYRDLVVSQIDATADTVEFTNGITLKAGEAYGDLSERDIRRIQIRETIRAHLEKERQLFAQGVKVLSLFFIDEVAKYRDYSRDDQNGEYARMIEQLVYDSIDERYDADIFTAAEIGQDFSRATERLKNHVFDYCITDSGVERDFVGELDTSAEVEVYAKLPRGFLIPTPVGDYNPDWAIVFRAGAVKHIYFVAETKGSMSSLALRDLERAKIDCAKKFFAKLAESNPTPNVRYGVADSYNKLMEIVTT